MAKSSPFEVVHQRLGANFAEYDGWRLPRDYGDIDTEKAALTQHSVAFDLSSFGKIQIKGAQNSALIDELIALHGQKPSHGQWNWAKISDSNESIDPVRICGIKQGYIVFTRPKDRERAFGLISRVAQQGFSGVEIADLTEKTGMLGIYGPEAVDAAVDIMPFDISDIEKGEVLSLSLFMMSVTIIRGSWTGGDGLELLCPASVAPLAADALTKYQEKDNFTPAGFDCLRAAMDDFTLDLAQSSEARKAGLNKASQDISG